MKEGKERERDRGKCIADISRRGENGNERGRVGDKEEGGEEESGKATWRTRARRIARAEGHENSKRRIADPDRFCRQQWNIGQHVNVSRVDHKYSAASLPYVKRRLAQFLPSQNRLARSEDGLRKRGCSRRLPRPRELRVFDYLLFFFERGGFAIALSILSVKVIPYFSDVFSRKSCGETNVTLKTEKKGEREREITLMPYLLRRDSASA